MRIATMIISLVLTLVVWVQSCAVAVGGGLEEELATTPAERGEGEELSGAGGLGLLGGILWVVGAGFVLSKPGVARWFYLAAAAFLLGAGAAGFSDAYIWAVVSLVFTAMSWRGIREKRDKEAEEQQRQFQQFQQWQQQQPGSPAGGAPTPGASTPPPASAPQPPARDADPDPGREPPQPPQVDS